MSHVRRACVTCAASCVVVRRCCARYNARCAASSSSATAAALFAELYGRPRTPGDDDDNNNNTATTTKTTSSTKADSVRATAHDEASSTQQRQRQRRQQRPARRDDTDAALSSSWQHALACFAAARYASPQHVARRVCWRTLCALRATHDAPAARRVHTRTRLWRRALEVWQHCDDADVRSAREVAVLLFYSRQYGEVVTLGWRVLHACARTATATTTATVTTTATTTRERSAHGQHDDGDNDDVTAALELLSVCLLATMRVATCRTATTTTTTTSRGSEMRDRDVSRGASTHSVAAFVHHTQTTRWLRRALRLLVWQQQQQQQQHATPSSLPHTRLAQSVTLLLWTLQWCQGCRDVQHRDLLSSSSRTSATAATGASSRTAVVRSPPLRRLLRRLADAVSLRRQHGASTTTQTTTTTTTYALLLPRSPWQLRCAGVRAMAARDATELRRLFATARRGEAAYAMLGIFELTTWLGSALLCTLCERASSSPSSSLSSLSLSSWRQQRQRDADAARAVVRHVGTSLPPVLLARFGAAFVRYNMSYDTTTTTSSSRDDDHVDHSSGRSDNDDSNFEHNDDSNSSHDRRRARGAYAAAVALLGRMRGADVYAAMQQLLFDGDTDELARVQMRYGDVRGDDNNDDDDDKSGVVVAANWRDALTQLHRAMTGESDNNNNNDNGDVGQHGRVSVVSTQPQQPLQQLHWRTTLLPRTLRLLSDAGKTRDVLRLLPEYDATRGGGDALVVAAALAHALRRSGQWWRVDEVLDLVTRACVPRNAAEDAALHSAYLHTLCALRNAKRWREALALHAIMHDALPPLVHGHHGGGVCTTTTAAADGCNAVTTRHRQREAMATQATLSVAHDQTCVVVDAVAAASLAAVERRLLWSVVLDMPRRAPWQRALAALQTPSGDDADGSRGGGGGGGRDEAAAAPVAMPRSLSLLLRLVHARDTPHDAHGDGVSVADTVRLCRNRTALLTLARHGRWRPLLVAATAMAQRTHRHVHDDNNDNNNDDTDDNNNDDDNNDSDDDDTARLARVCSAVLFAVDRAASWRDAAGASALQQLPWHLLARNAPLRALSLLLRQAFDVALHHAWLPILRALLQQLRSPRDTHVVTRATTASACRVASANHDDDDVTDAHAGAASAQAQAQQSQRARERLLDEYALLTTFALDGAAALQRHGKRSISNSRDNNNNNNNNNKKQQKSNTSTAASATATVVALCDAHVVRRMATLLCASAYTLRVRMASTRSGSAATHTLVARRLRVPAVCVRPLPQRRQQQQQQQSRCRDDVWCVHPVPPLVVPWRHVVACLDGGGVVVGYKVTAALLTSMARGVLQRLRVRHTYVLAYAMPMAASGLFVLLRAATAGRGSVALRLRVHLLLTPQHDAAPPLLSTRYYAKYNMYTTTRTTTTATTTATSNEAAAAAVAVRPVVSVCAWCHAGGGDDDDANDDDGGSDDAATAHDEASAMTDVLRALVHDVYAEGWAVVEAMRDMGVTYHIDRVVVVTRGRTRSATGDDDVIADVSTSELPLWLRHR